MLYVIRVTAKRKRSRAAAPITGIATGSLGTAANLEDTQVLKTQDLNAAAPALLDDHAHAAAFAEELPPGHRTMIQPSAVAPAPGYEAPPARPANLRAGRSAPRARSGHGDRRRTLAIVGAGALAALILLAAGGILSQLDFGVNGGEPSSPAFGLATEPPPAATPKPKEEGGKGHGKDNCHGRHCH